MKAATIGIALALVLTGTVSAQDWFDDFDDGSVADASPIAWVPDAALPALMTVSDGDLVLQVQVEDVRFLVGGAVVPIEFSSGISIRARMRALLDDDGIGLYSPGQDVAYVAELYLGELSVLGATAPDRAAVLDVAVTGLDVTADVLLQLDIFDGVIEVTAWRPGDAVPWPQLSVRAPDFGAAWGAGTAGAFVQQNSCDPARPDAIAQVRYMQASSTRLTHSDIGDFDANGRIDGADMGLLLANWTAGGGCTSLPCVGDLNNDFYVNGIDLGILLTNWSDS